MAVQLTSAPPVGPASADDRMALLAVLSREISSTADAATCLDLMLPDIARAVSAGALAIVDCDGPGGTTRCRAAYGLPATLPGMAFDGGLPVDIGPGTSVRIDWGIPVAATLWAPIAAGAHWFGAVVALNPAAGSCFSREDSVFLETVARIAALGHAVETAANEGPDPAAMRGELELAAEIQRNLLPAWNPSEMPVQGINRPARTVSGDFYDFLSLPGGRVPFALGDVSGKGMNAALMMAKTVSLFRCLAKTIYDPAVLLRALNDELYDTATRGMFVTMVAGIYEPVSGALRFANAGHEPPLLRQQAGEYLAFPAEAPPLGIRRDLKIETTEIDIGGGEFYIFSDGLTEFGYGEDEFLGVKGLKQMIEGLADVPLVNRMESLLGELDRQGWEARDDLTVLTIDGSWVKKR